MEELTALVTRARAGNRNAYDALVSRFQDMAVGYAYSILGDFHLTTALGSEMCRASRPLPFHRFSLPPLNV